ncbi:MAG: Mur ligase family protein [Bullifex sp.]
MITAQILSSLLGGVFISERDAEITSLEFDSRAVKAGSCFFAFGGIHTDGNLFVDDAVKNGAVMIVTGKHPGTFLKEVSYLITERPVRELYAEASKAFFGSACDKLKLIGVTGTDGKTTTCEMIHQLMNALGYKCGLVSTVSMDSGSGKHPSPFRQSTPEAFPLHAFFHSCVSNGLEYAVVECTSHALSDEYCRLKGVRFAISIVTSVSSEHLDFHKTQEEYYRAKANLARHTYGPVLIYDDCPALSFFESASGHRLVMLERPEITYTSLSETRFIHKGEERTVPLFGTYNASNFTEAAEAVSRLTGTPIDALFSRSSCVKAPDGRFEVLNALERTFIIDFAHTPDSFSKLLSEMRKAVPEGHFITLFGAAGERDKSKRAGLGHEASLYSATMIITEEDPRGENQTDIALDILEGVDERMRKLIHIYTEEKREDAIRLAISLSEPGDTVFLLGKGHENSIAYRDGKRAYSEKEAMMEAIREVQ